MPHDHDHTDAPSDLELRVKALESPMVEKGLVDPAALDALIDTYYRHWLTAFEDLIAERWVLDLSDLESRKEEWRNAYLATPHGEPIELRNGE